jgi:DNA-directed RNA polymerase specialized sigma24 family protein
MRELIAAICDDTRAPEARDAAWRRLLVRLAPHVERWARESRLLRRCRLASEDDVRAVVVGVIERLSSRRFEALRRLDAREARTVDDDEEHEAEVLDRVVRIALEPPPDTSPPADDPDGAATPLRAWLAAVTRYAAADHVRHRLGWSEGAGGTKRALGTDAERLDAVAEPSHRPPVTDHLARKRLLEEIAAFMATLPAAMREALELWLDDLSFEQIAERLSLGGPERARALIRAGQARLRERFRGQWPEIPALSA